MIITTSLTRVLYNIPSYNSGPVLRELFYFLRHDENDFLTNSLGLMLLNGFIKYPHCGYSEENIEE
jgi:hypothetical protein